MEEIRQTVAFIAAFLEPRPSSPISPDPPDQSRMSSFRETLTAILSAHYENHWYPETPLRGSAFRSLELPGSVLVLRAAKESGVQVRGDEFGDSGLVLWCDPGSVDFRLGDRGYTQCVYDAARRRPTFKYEPGRGLVSAALSPRSSNLSRESSPRSFSPDVRTLSTSPSRGPSPTAPKEFVERLTQRGVTTKSADEGKKKEAGKKDKRRRDSGYVSPGEAHDLRMTTVVSSPDIFVQG
ncbi:hypothetical protein M427DRAFT_53662 [Gonapodya prolifera JEL478]|uniref:Anti-proliferative protein domain-containing protein n=1 Tax=Gonapodya prolifera (strain JEL478) TaxID=1344416 RepID=A0A139APQ0_GONPJ|nr:hypothetical protein M427DRAFT_53662 [Gonapodya prolifera JEL478]|eukprot:KXS18716.1 hypothetical protein M427DRAFT_53662 [Gonapodya prolifera JEL478]